MKVSIHVRLEGSADVFTRAQVQALVDQLQDAIDSDVCVTLEDNTFTRAQVIALIEAIQSTINDASRISIS